MTEDIVSPFSNARISKIMIVIILAVGVAFQSFEQYYHHSEEIVIAVSLSSMALVIGFATRTYIRYYGSSVFGRSYLFLMLAFVFVFIGEVTYNIYAFVFGVDPYPSLADVFFFMLYPFSLIHILINIWAFRPISNKRDKIMPVVIIASTSVLFLIVSANAVGDVNFDVGYATVFVTGAVTITTYGFWGLAATRKIPIGRAWTLLVSGIVLGTIADIWYQHLEMFGSYETSGIVNVLWYVSYWTIGYALYKHVKII